MHAKNLISLQMICIGLLALSTTALAHASQTFNYGEALQKAIFFYDIQRLGRLSTATGDLTNRLNWRGDSFLQDYALHNDEGVIDLGGGFADAGDNVKFNFPMAASMTLLAWDVIEHRDILERSGQLKALLANLKWGMDYLLKCWDPVNKKLYGQVSPDSVQAEHSNLWMPYEVVDQASIDKSLIRNAFYVDENHPGTDLASEMTAAFAAASMAFQPINADYANKLLSAAKSLYTLMVNVPNKGNYSDNMGRPSNGGWIYADIKPFYNSWSGFRDEVSWAATWLYRATQDTAYLDVAKEFIGYGNVAATLSWDDKSYGTYLLLAKLLPDADPDKVKAKQSAEGWLDSWAEGKNGHIFSNDGLAIATGLAPWGNARYAATTAFGALIYNEYFGSKKYETFAKNQIDYLLGKNSKNFSYLTGFNKQFPKQPHHATAQGGWSGNNDVNSPQDNRHIAYGGLVGGPKDANDTYEDKRSDYIGNEVALDYNAGLVGALTTLYGTYGGNPLPDDQFPPKQDDVAPPDIEIFVNGSVQSGQINSNQSSVQVSLLATNRSAWPARVTDNLKLKYFLNLADKPKNGTVTVKTFSTDPRAVVSDVQLFDERNKIYYVEVWFKDLPIYPGGDDRVISSKETQLQFQFSWPHDYRKDWSYQGLIQNSFNISPNIPIFQVINGADQLFFGKEPMNKPQGKLTINFASNVPAECVGAQDSMIVGNLATPSFKIGSTPFIFETAAGRKIAVSLNSATNPIAVQGGSCRGSLNASQVNIPGSLTARYVFTATPQVDHGTLQIAISPETDERCNKAQDSLFIDNETTGRPFIVGTDGITQIVNAGVRVIRLSSQISIPVADNQSGSCTSLLDRTSVRVMKDQISTINARYQFTPNPVTMSCHLIESAVLVQSDWGSQYGIVNQIEAKFNLVNFPKDANGKTNLNGTFITVNNIIQNFWGSFGMLSSSFSNSIGTFTGEANIDANNPLTLSGFILNTTPLKVGDNPFNTIVINGVTCR